MKYLLLLISCLLTSGCISTKNIPVNKDTAVIFEGKSLTQVQAKAPSFYAATSGKAFFGALGTVAANAAGYKMVKENNIVDPAINISNEIAETL